MATTWDESTAELTDISDALTPVLALYRGVAVTTSSTARDVCAYNIEDNLLKALTLWKVT